MQTVLEIQETLWFSEYTEFEGPLGYLDGGVLWVTGATVGEKPVLEVQVWKSSVQTCQERAEGK